MRWSEALLGWAQINGALCGLLLAASGVAALIDEARRRRARKAGPGPKASEDRVPEAARPSPGPLRADLMVNSRERLEFTAVTESPDQAIRLLDQHVRLTTR